MCRCNKKYSESLEHVRNLAKLMAVHSGEIQAIFHTEQGYNFVSKKLSEGKNIIEMITP
jgi:hypothetical protein